MADENINTNDNESNLPIKLNKNVMFEGLKDESRNKNIHPDNGALTRTMVVNKKIEDYSLDDLGKIEYAKKHRSANRPLHKLDEFTDNVNFCHCCNLPCEEKGIIEPFHFCDDIDLFSECGLGITLYFYFFQFIVLIAFLGIVVLSITTMIFNFQYTDSIIDICNDYFADNLDGKNTTYCEGYLNSENVEQNKRCYRWISRFSSDNIRIYRFIPKLITTKYIDNIDDVVVNYSILNFCFLVTAFILNIYFILFIKAQAQKARVLNFSIRDYTVLITDSKRILYEFVEMRKKSNPTLMRGSQIAVENGKDFKVFVNDYLRGHEDLDNIKINCINLCFDLGSYMAFRDDYETCKRNIFQVEHHPYNIKLNEERGLIGDQRLYYKFYLYQLKIYWLPCCHDNGFPLETLKKQKKDLENQLEEEQKNAEFVTEDNFTGYMLVSFERIGDKELFLKNFPHHFFARLYYYLKNIKYYLFCCCVNKEKRERFNRSKSIDAFDPPEPEDIIWENFKYSARERGIRTILIFLLCLLIMLVSLVCVLGLTFVQDNIYQRERHQGVKTNIFLKYLISFAITIVISIINAIFQVVLEEITHKEKQISRSNYILSLSIKIAIFTFLNSAIVPLISKQLVLTWKDDYLSDHNDTYLRYKERDNLLVDDMLVYFIVNAIITPILWSLNLMYFINYLKRCCIECGKNPDENHYMTQKDLNDLYLRPDMNLAYKYSYLVKTIAMCLFFYPIFPLGFIFAFVGFILGYHLEKFNFTHIYRRPEMLGDIIASVYADYFIVILFIGGIGDYFFLDNDFKDNKWALANIIIFGILVIIPYTKFFDCNFIGIDKSQYNNIPLSDVYFTFYNDYQRQNPLTKRIGLINYLTELKRYEYLSDYAYKIAQDNIEQLNLMEIYYGVSRGNIPISHQSIIANANNASILSTGNVTRSILGRGFLKSTIVKPEIQDNPEAKKQKKKFFESQIFNMFGKKQINKGLRENIDTIDEENDDETRDQLADAYNNPLGINMGLGPLPLTTSIYKDEDDTHKK